MTSPPVWSSHCGTGDGERGHYHHADTPAVSVADEWWKAQTQRTLNGNRAVHFYVWGWHGGALRAPGMMAAVVAVL